MTSTAEKIAPLNPHLRNGGQGRTTEASSKPADDRKGSKAG